MWVEVRRGHRRLPARGHGPRAQCPRWLRGCPEPPASRMERVSGGFPEAPASIQMGWGHRGLPGAEVWASGEIFALGKALLFQKED